MKKHWWTLCLVVLAAISSICYSPVWGATLPQVADEIHLGVATCASGVCHGSINPRSTTRIPQNEYVIWSKLDRHRDAYKILLNEDSQYIAQNLGLENAHEAAICLDCHADNVSPDKRGARFQISECFGCVFCHGGAGSYISSHTNPDHSHQDNIDQGMYPTDRLKERASLCLSCHLGNKDKIASHKIMGAGHPRLSFELDTFGILQPAHFVMDDDYKAEKSAATSLSTWASGQIETGYQTLNLLDAHLVGPANRMFPELSLFDCHACHHTMSDQRWQLQARNGLPPGTVRLNDVGFVMLLPLANVMSSQLKTSFSKAIENLHTAVEQGKNISASITSLRSEIETLDSQTSKRNLDGAALLAEVLLMGERGELNDYAAAEQAVMAIDILLSATHRREVGEQWLDELYSAVEDEDRFDPFEFVDLFGKAPD